MASMQAAPVLSTPDNHILEKEPDASPTEPGQPLVDEQLYISYEIERTAADIRQRKYRRVALQFPDSMLKDAPRVYRQLENRSKISLARSQNPLTESPQSSQVKEAAEPESNLSESSAPPKFFILGDTSYAPCCVDEIAAEHASADVVVHYGRACLSPTARIPAIHIFTKKELIGLEAAAASFRKIYEDLDQKIVLMSDIPYQDHLATLTSILRDRGYTSIFSTDILHDPASPIPNRTVPEEVRLDPSRLKDWAIFHVADPPESLLLILASRVASFRMCPVLDDPFTSPEIIQASSTRALSRRYALLTSVSSASVFGILINTLSVKNYQQVLDKVKMQISAANKKYYVFVVGKLNAAKVANFGEIDAWVVIGCWESSLIDSKDFWKPLITPFELRLALQSDEERLWTGEWSSDFQTMLTTAEHSMAHNDTEPNPSEDDGRGEILDDEPESEPPEFDLRRGQYVPRSRRVAAPSGRTTAGEISQQTLAVRAKGDVALVGGAPSAGAEYLHSRRTWTGLGSDFEIAYEEDGAPIEEGRSGIARGYANANAGHRT